MFPFPVSIVASSARYLGKQVMWRYSGFTGCKPPQKKKAIKDDRKDYFAKYEANCADRKFQDSWKLNRDWLHYDEKDKVMFCEYCRNYGAGSDNAWKTGTTELKLDSIKKHEITKKKLNAFKHKNMNKEITEAERGMILMSKDFKRKATILMNNAHAIAKKRRPMSDFEWQCK